MKIVIIGGTGLIGTKVASHLSQLRHTVITGSPSTGINSITGEGISEAMQGTDIVIDLSNSPSFETEQVLEFFETSGRNLMAAEVEAGVKHHLALSIVGVDRMLDLGYMRAKKVQEDLIRNSGIPFTIIRSTQFLEFIPALAAAATQGDEVHVSDVDFQPIAAEDVAKLVADFALADAENLTPEIAGPERRAQSDFIAAYIQEKGNHQKVIPNQKNEYFGGLVPQDGLVPQGQATLGEIDFATWVSDNL
ncbi:predicted nucleoside-diphosphate-sugar epimerase [Pedobacter sp. BAL39]|uniref:SDR family oxidoreductase n=1 Tax=Pedobacter sp. BAL39 TaxID=391596 RepID=UPI00015594D3|nr:SDR family oxidoreductase [Pedobacter sp. BAL39]EDM37989.1 predicted nucleoside-diphosphate-sugar epimerase [Pedobacter sp. BAL39]